MQVLGPAAAETPPLMSVLALRVVSSPHTMMSGNGAEADMRRCFGPVAGAAVDTSLHLAANFAVTHNAALW